MCITTLPFWNAKKWSLKAKGQTHFTSRPHFVEILLCINKWPHESEGPATAHVHPCNESWWKFPYDLWCLADLSTLTPECYWALECHMEILSLWSRISVVIPDVFWPGLMDDMWQCELIWDGINDSVFIVKTEIYERKMVFNCVTFLI